MPQLKPRSPSTKRGKLPDASGTLRQVERLLLELKPDELVQIRARIAILIGTKGTPAPSDNKENQNWVLDGVAYELYRRGLWPAGMFNRLIKIAPNCEVKASVVCKELLRQMHGPMTPTLLAALGQFAARCLADYLVTIKLPLGPKTMLNNIGLTLPAIDASFPGYMEAGILRLCLTGPVLQHG